MGISIEAPSVLVYKPDAIPFDLIAFKKLPQPEMERLLLGSKAYLLPSDPKELPSQTWLVGPSMRKIYEAYTGKPSDEWTSAIADPLMGIMLTVDGVIPVVIPEDIFNKTLAAFESEE